MKYSIILVMTTIVTMTIPCESYSTEAPVLVDTTAFIDKACIRFESSFTFEVLQEVWEQVIEHPLLLGELWELYGFKPSYNFQSVDGEVHVVDGTGIDGYLSYAGGNSTTRVLMARGRLRNWGLPIGVNGRALFILHWIFHDSVVDIRLSIYGEGTGSAADIIIKAFSPILKFFINRRVNANVRDFSVILKDIAYDNIKVRNMLDDDLRLEFDGLLSDISHQYE